MLAIGSDHAGFLLKQEIMEFLNSNGFSYKDFGTYSEDSCDYPVFGEAVGRAVATGTHDSGILICGTGIGISIAANKVKGVRCACCTDPFSAEMARRHNDANVLALGARVTGSGLALNIVSAFLKYTFEGGRHQKRVSLFSEIECR